ncbi:MAG TPA: hypothetical protein VK631_07665, partial [Solirubrobacteraceae bacterium]|nr:hypothetical protein [Solirubrobacteraceae bacterium]
MILLGFAAIVGVLTTRSLRADFNRETASAADDLKKTITLQVVDEGGQPRIRLDSKESPNLNDYDASLN